MSKQAQVGAFAILALLLLFGIFYVITDLGTRYSGYRIGVHFASAAGLSSGAIVYFSGVSVGSVDSIQLLPDNTVDVILAVNRDVDIPKASKFLIQAPLTGSPSLLIVPPRPTGEPEALLQRRVLPVPLQPQGTNSASIADLLTEGQGEIRKLDGMLTQLQEREPHMLASLDSSLDNANAISQQARVAIAQLTTQFAAIAGTTQQAMGTLNGTLSRNSGRVDSLLASLDSTAIALNESTKALRSIATDPAMKRNVVDTTQNIADLTKSLAQLAHDMRNVTGNPQTQAQLRDTVAQIDAASQRANSLLADLGGTSHVYGVDHSATPAPAGSALPSAAPAPRSAPRAGLSSLASNLYAVQVRFSSLSAQRAPASSPLLSRDRGPQTDINLLLLPHSETSFMTGANDIGGRTTYNFALVRRFAPHLHLGAGALYSQFGVLGRYNFNHFGVEGRAYNLRRPELDLYGNYNLNKWSQLFLGQRDLNHNDRRTVFGLQLQF